MKEMFVCLFVCRPSRAHFGNMETTPMLAKCCKIKAYARLLYRATRALTQSFSNILRSTAPISTLIMTSKGYWESIQMMQKQKSKFAELFILHVLSWAWDKLSQNARLMRPYHECECFLLCLVTYYLKFATLYRQLVRFP